MFGVVEAIVTLMYSVYLPSCLVLQGGKPGEREREREQNFVEQRRRSGEKRAP